MALDDSERINSAYDLNKISKMRERLRIDRRNEKDKNVYYAISSQLVSPYDLIELSKMRRKYSSH